jgi:hypothetical protein
MSLPRTREQLKALLVDACPLREIKWIVTQPLHTQHWEVCVGNAEDIRIERALLRWARKLMESEAVGLSQITMVNEDGWLLPWLEVPYPV